MILGILKTDIEAGLNIYIFMSDVMFRLLQITKSFQG